MAESKAKTEEDKASDSAAEGAEGEAAAPAKSNKKLFLIIGLVALLLIGGGAGAYFAGVFGGGEEKATAEGEAATTAEGEAAADDPAKPPVYYNVPDMIVNLQSERGRPVFLKISMSLEMRDETDVPALERVLPRVIDNFQVYLRELRVEELRGSAGMYRLREELLMRVNQAVAPLKVKDVLFREMLVQ